MKSVFKSPEFKIVWLICAILAAALAVAVFYIPLPIVALEAMLILAAGVVLVFWAYTLIQKDREGVIGKNELKSIIFNLEDGVIFYDKDFKVLFFNPAAEKLFSMNAADVLGHV